MTDFGWRAESVPRRYIVAALAVPVVAVVFTIIVPGFVAAHGEVFYTSTIERKLPKAQRTVLTRYRAEQTRRQQLLQQHSATVASALAHGDDTRAEIALRERNQLQDEILRAKPPIEVIPFYLNPQMLSWCAAYTCLGWMIILIAPPTTVPLRHLVFNFPTVYLIVLTYVAYEWPLWMRNFVLSDEGRVIYAFPNYDMHPGSFFMQEAVVFGFCAQLTIVWRQWLAYLRQVQVDDPASEVDRNHLSLLTDSAAAASFREVFFRWVVASLILLLGFSGLTALYWELVARHHDQRYLISAFLVHLLWGITWVVISLPLLNEWQVWAHSRTMALQALAEMQNSEDALRRSALLKEIQPVTGVTLIAANATSVVTFILPIIQAFV